MIRRMIALLLAAAAVGCGSKTPDPPPAATGTGPTDGLPSVDAASAGEKMGGKPLIPLPK